MSEAPREVRAIRPIRFTAQNIWKIRQDAQDVRQDNKGDVPFKAHVLIAEGNATVTAFGKHSAVAFTTATPDVNSENILRDILIGLGFYRNTLDALDHIPEDGSFILSSVPGQATELVLLS